MTIEEAIHAIRKLSERMACNEFDCPLYANGCPDENGMFCTEAFELALSALREQAERDKGCEYCAGYEAEFMLPVIEMSENTANSLDIDGNFAYIHCHCGRHTVGKINFCPMCGRRLGKRRESEVT